MTEIDCAEIKRSVHEYLHNELSPEQLDFITAHLANCDSCDADYDLENTINQKIEEHCKSTPSQELLDGIMERLRQIQAGEEH